MKLPTLIAFFIVMISSFSGFGMTEISDKLELVTFSQTEQQDSLTITVFVSFTVNENGKVGQPKVEKTECSEYDIKELDKKAVKKLEKEALRVIEEMDNLDPIEKPTRYTQPIKMRLPTEGFLRKQ
jgi:hypothetical protein